MPSGQGFVFVLCTILGTFHRSNFPAMIDETLKFLADRLNEYLLINLSSTTERRVVAGSVVRAADGEADKNGDLKNKVIISLVNVEEDRIARQQENSVKTPTGVVYQNPPVYLNLYALIAVNHTEYITALNWLSLIVRFFQSRQVFTPGGYPDLDSRINKLMVDLYTLGFEQLNQLWSILGGKQLPSVLYKIRQVTIDEEATEQQGGLIMETDVHVLKHFGS